MARVKRGLTTHAKHKKLLKKAKGFMMTRSRLVRKATEAVLHAGAYSYMGRKKKKRVARQDWILHISEAVKQQGMSYSQFINKLKVANIELDRKVLAELATQHTSAFQEIFKSINK